MKEIKNVSVFLDIKTKEDLCRFLDISEKKLHILLYAKNIKKYDVIEVKKKNGDKRIIHSPNKELKFIQKKILAEFERIYLPNKSTMGFIKGRSIVKNASEHIKRQFLLNFDVKDFFPSITYYRVAGLLRNKPFSFPENIVNIIANILTYNNQLPQGAPTSPIISNMICRRMDNQFNRFVKKYNAVYSRYGDDITISWNNNKVTNIFIAKESNVILSDDIVNIITQNGFLINDAKTRFSSYKSHQQVTGLVVNEKINIKKDFYYRLRARIHAWETFGLTKSAQAYCKKYNLKYIKKISEKQFEQIVLGMLGFLKMVVGNSDKRFIRLGTKVNSLMENNLFKFTYDLETLRDESVYVISADMSSEPLISGTAFKIQDYYVTCKHCIFSDSSNENIDMPVFIWTNSQNKEVLKIKYISDKFDLVFLSSQQKRYNKPYFNLIDGEIEDYSDVNVLGFPDYESGDTISYFTTQITGKRIHKKAEYYTLNAPIQPGISGGPVTNKKTNEIIGMIVLGSKSYTQSYINNGFLDVKHIKQELERISENK